MKLIKSTFTYNRCISDVDINMRSVIKELLRDPQELHNLLHGNPYDESSTMSSLNMIQADNSMHFINGNNDSINSASSSIGKNILIFYIRYKNFDAMIHFTFHFEYLDFGTDGTIWNRPSSVNTIGDTFSGKFFQANY